ncbi:uncharacterized protein FIBRA_04503 [Fibroporia radiculosa]|uniref:rRNA-processing protein FYV7 n=1 Tax=Fibroporia radiculosa TaxID=599839 RepID=J4GPD0_9APHY|nr:uncharacterized protein FIBRA_04503 [Fibroporia radiculosa]CCM02405.1 predicted protein [Fibroporia radiculosa]
MASASDTAQKRKPPTFRHLPTDRAKKLKRSWVEKQKIKSQWKAQKRKEGLESKGRRLADLVASTDEQEEKAQSSNAESSEPVNAAPTVSIEEESGNENESSEDEPEDRSSPRKPPAKKASPREDTPGRQPTLRELQSQAYSRSSLHTRKSDPLHRRRGSDMKRADAPAGGRGRGRGQGGRGAASSQRGRGRGQPDMRLRMNVMLEKIKRDFT